MFQNKNERIELLKDLSLAFGPTGCEMPAAELIIDKLNALGYSHKLDRLGNVTVYARDEEEAWERFEQEGWEKGYSTEEYFKIESDDVLSVEEYAYVGRGA